MNTMHEFTIRIGDKELELIDAIAASYARPRARKHVLEEAMRQGIASLGYVRLPDMARKGIRLPSRLEPPPL